MKSGQEIVFPAYTNKHLLMGMDTAHRKNTRRLSSRLVLSELTLPKALTPKIKWAAPFILLNGRRPEFQLNLI